MKHVRFTVMTLVALTVGHAATTVVWAKETAQQERAEKLPAPISPLVRTVDLDIGQMQEIELADGSKARVKLIDVQETRDRVRNAVREARVTVEVNGATQALISAMYNLPVMVGGVQIDCSITRGCVTGSRQQNPWALKKDARLRLWPAGSPWIRPGTFTYPVRQRWFASDTQMANEPCYVNGGELPSQKAIYYHWGLDFGGAEGLVEVVAATDGLVVSAADQTLPEHKDSPAKPRYDVIYIVDGRGWYYRYSHLMTIEVKPGQRVRMGERIGLLGKEGGSGGWSHLHFDITSPQPSGEWGIQEAYAYAWQAYQQEYRPKIIAVARPHHLVTVGEKVTLDGRKSWSATGKITRYEWTFTDGGTATKPVIERIYQQPGTYNEILRVTDEAGQVAWDFAVVEVQDLSRPDQLPPSIHPVYFPTTGIRPGDAVTFKVRTFRTTEGEERWDFGDGSPPVSVRSDGNANVHAKDGFAVTEHRYTQPGRYLVCVERSNQRGEKAVGRLIVQVEEPVMPRTRVAIREGRWFLNDEMTYPGTQAEGLLMNVRMVNATFEDRRRPDFDPEANTDEFVAQIPDYVAHGVRGFTLCLQGGMPGYEGALNSAFNPDGSLRESYLRRVQRVIEACDRHGAAVILGCYYQRQDQVLKDEAAVRAGVVNVAEWIERNGFTSVVLEIANEFGHGGYDHRLLKTADGIAELIRLAKETSPTSLVSASGLGSGRLPDSVAQASDFLLIHFNNTRVDDIPARIAAVKKYDKPIVCNEDEKIGREGVRAAELCVANGTSWGLMHVEVNQHYPFMFQGAADDPEVYAALKRLTSGSSTSASSMGVPPMKDTGRMPVTRMIIETDAGGDPDDEQSLVRFLLYANEWDIEGIIPNRPATRRPENKNPEDTGLGVVRRLLDAYGRCYPNLVQHDPRYPTQEYLWQRTVPGYNDTDEAMNLIIAAVDKDDPRPVWYSDWGTDHGAATNNLKRALDLVLRERGPEGYAKFKSKLRLSSYNKFGEHTTTIAPPFAIWIDTFQPPVDGKRWYHRYSALTSKAGGFDLQRDVLVNGGPLGVLYPTNTGLWGKEGDTMTFLYLVPTGMNDPHEPGWGSWAGRYGPNENFPGKPYYWANQTDTWNGTTHRDNTLARWAADLQNDFRARLAWCVKPPREANHAPRAVVNGSDGKEILRIMARPGQELSFDGGLSQDPDGDTLSYEWLVYGEAGTYEGEATLTNASSPRASLRVPADAAGKTIHVLLTARDSGTPPLAAYRRIVVQVLSESATAGDPSASADRTGGRFVEANRGVELGPIRSLGHGITPGIATDSYGGVHIVYMDAGRIWYVQADAAGTFRDPQEISAPEGEAVYNSPHLVLDSEDVPHLVFVRDFTAKAKKAWYTNRRQGVWKPPIEAICAPEQRVNYPRLAVTENVALVGAFTPGAGFSGTLAKIVDLSSTPRVAGTATTLLWIPTPFAAGEEWTVLGRAGPTGHMLQAYGPDLAPAGTMRKISMGTPSKTGEPIAGLRDTHGMVHAVGITGFAGEGGHRDRLWYNNSARVEAGQGVILGPVFSAGVSEYVYPSMTQDAAGRLYLAYRDFDTGEGKIVTVSPEGFGAPISVTPSTTKRLRWNPQIAAGTRGHLYVVWDDDDTVYFRAIRVTDTAGAPKTAVPPYFPPPESQGGWRKLDKPQDVRDVAGMDPAKLDELKQWLLQSDKRNFAAVVIRRGHIVLEVERGNSAKTDSRRVASVSKAVCATVLAIASEQSQRGLTPKRMTFDDPAFEFIPWAQPLSDPRKAQITVRQLLNHTSGLCPEAVGAPNDGTWEYVLGHSGDPRTAKLAFDPGAGCGYTTHALHHAALVCETVTGKSYDEFAIEALFKPLGIERWWFQYFEGGKEIGRHPTHGLGMPARELARIAYCMLREGRWGDRQAIPKWFVDETAAPTHNVTSPEMRWKLDPRTFSHGWELAAVRSEGIPADARYKPGSGGQLVAFVPSLDLVISRQTGSSGDWAYEEYLRRACAAVFPEVGPNVK